MGGEINRYNDASEEEPLRLVVCPHCKGDSVYHPSNPSRPFCSPRCRAMDLGAWANEDFRVADNSLRDASDFNDA